MNPFFSQRDMLVDRVVMERRSNVTLLPPPPTPSPLRENRPLASNRSLLYLLPFNGDSMLVTLPVAIMCDTQCPV
uniref:Uncharacterized protein n=1 Tax=Vespula pensylvanica TaxID=30213 RepID=A0A834NQ09_VESPE|nr:hypothetical protein H0235_012008 [Vespula pensylvanica]